VVSDGSGMGWLVATITRSDEKETLKHILS